MMRCGLYSNTGVLKSKAVHVMKNMISWQFIVLEDCEEPRLLGSRSLSHEEMIIYWSTTNDEQQ